MTVSVRGLMQLFEAGELRPGDGVLSRNPRGSAVSGVIRAGQYLALRDYPHARISKAAAWDAAQFSHAMIAVGAAGIAEQTYPRCWCRSWDELAGSELVFFRWRDATATAQLAAVGAALEDVGKRLKYPVSELGYYGKWFFKTAAGRKFASVFDNRDDARGVCSAQLLHWYKVAGIAPASEPPNAWYPARFMIDGQCEVLARFELAGGKPFAKGCSPEPPFQKLFWR